LHAILTEKQYLSNLNETVSIDVNFKGELNIVTQGLFDLIKGALGTQLSSKGISLDLDQENKLIFECP